MGRSVGATALALFRTVNYVSKANGVKRYGVKRYGVKRYGVTRRAKPAKPAKPVNLANPANLAKPDNLAKSPHPQKFLQKSKRIALHTNTRYTFQP